MQKRVLFGWILLIIGIMPFLTFLTFGRPQYAAWFSNHTFIILGLALLLKSPFWAFAQLCIGAIPELVWSADFLARAFTGSHIWGFTSYMFKNGTFDLLHLYSLQHILFVPAAVYAIYLLKGPVKQAWLGSLAHLDGLRFSLQPKRYPARKRPPAEPSSLMIRWARRISR